MIDYGNRNISWIVRRYEQLYDEEKGGWNLTNGDDGTLDYASVEMEVGRFYYAFINLVGAKYVLETGTNRGYSTALIAAALKNKNKDGKLITFDTVAHDHLFNQKDFDNIIFINENSITCKLDIDIEFDILVLDSDHTYHTIINELIRYEKYLRIGGYILMHDTLYYDGVGLAVEQLINNPRFETITLESPRTHGRQSRCPGVSIVRKNSDDIRYPLVENQSLAKIARNMVPGETEQAESYVNRLRRKRLGTDL